MIPAFGSGPLRGPSSATSGSEGNQVPVSDPTPVMGTDRAPRLLQLRGEGVRAGRPGHALRVRVDGALDHQGRGRVGARPSRSTPNRRPVAPGNSFPMLTLNRLRGRDGEVAVAAASRPRTSRVTIDPRRRLGRVGDEDVGVRLRGPPCSPSAIAHACPSSCCRQRCAPPASPFPATTSSARR